MENSKNSSQAIRTHYDVSDIYLQATTHCNLDCKYCYLPSANRLNKNQMSFATLDKIITHLQANFDLSQLRDKAKITWHSGEPLSRGLAFFEYAANQIKLKLPGLRQQVQTNATLINDKFCEFFKSADYRVGVSIDGPKKIHDFNRVYRTQLGSFETTVRGLKKLNTHGIPLTIISVVSRNTMLNADVEELVDFLFEFNPREVGFSIEEMDGTHAGSELHIKQMQQENRKLYRNFLFRLFEAAGSRGLLNKIREFKNPYKKLTILSRDETVKFKSTMIEPFSHISYDHQGSFTCFSPELLAMTRANGEDFFFGNVFNEDDVNLEQIATKKKFLQAMAEIQSGVRQCQDTCEYYGYCPGGVPSNKLAENGTFDSTETFACQTSVMDGIDVTSHFLSSFLAKTPVNNVKI